MGGVIPESWEAIPGRMGGGWITPCPYGGRHLVGASWQWWKCPVCQRVAQQFRQDQEEARREMGEE